MDAASALPLVLITIGAVAMPGVAVRLAIPVAVAEIVFGLAIGQSGLDLVESTSFINFLAEVGFAFFMFTAGLEIDFRGVEKGGLKPGLVRFAHSAISFVLAGLVALAMGWGPWVALAIGATSVGLLVAILRETGKLGSELGKESLSQGAVGEALTIGLLSLAHLHHEASGTSEILIGIGRMVGLGLFAFFTVAVLRALVWWFPDAFGRLIAHDDPSELGVRVGFGLMFAFVGLSLLAHVEPFLGSFIAGAMLAFVIRDKGALEHKLASMAYGFFVPVFFINVGMRFELSATLLVNEAPTVLAIIAAMVLVKFLPNLIILRRGYTLAEVWAGSSLLAAPLTLVIAIVDIGMRSGAVDPATGGVVILGGILGSLVHTATARSVLRREDGERGPAMAGRPTGV